MGSMMFSALGMFASDWVQFVVFMVIAVWVYRICYASQKKRGETRRKTGESNMAKKYDSNSGTLGGFIAGVIITMIGLPFLSPVLLIVGIVLIVQNRGALAGKTAKPAPRKSVPNKPPAAAVHSPQTRPVRPVQPEPVRTVPVRTEPVRTVPRQSGSISYQSNARDHYHITNVGLSVERRLEQLEVMKNAGLLDKEEYQQRLQKILKDK